MVGWGSELLGFPGPGSFQSIVTGRHRARSLPCPQALNTTCDGSVSGRRLTVVHVHGSSFRLLWVSAWLGLAAGNNQVIHGNT